MPGTTSTISGEASICSCLGIRGAGVSIDSDVVTRKTYLAVAEHRTEQGPLERPYPGAGGSKLKPRGTSIRPRHAAGRGRRTSWRLIIAK